MTTGQTIFLCENNDELRGGISFLLRHTGFDVRAFAGGQALLQAIEEEPKPLRAIFVLDLDMPPMDGDVVHAELISRGFARRSPVIFLSGLGTIERAVRAMEKGAIDFMEKGKHIEQLVPLLHRAQALEHDWTKAANHFDSLKTMWDDLSPQQQKVAPLIARGSKNKVGARRLGISVRMFEVHRSNVFSKFQVRSSAELATRMAELKHGGVDVEGSLAQVK